MTRTVARVPTCSNASARGMPMVRCADGDTLAVGRTDISMHGRRQRDTQSCDVDGRIESLLTERLLHAHNRQRRVQGS